MKALELRVGKTAAKRLETEGWHADLVDGLIGASGGACAGAGATGGAGVAAACAVVAARRRERRAARRSRSWVMARGSPSSEVKYVVYTSLAREGEGRRGRSGSWPRKTHAGRGKRERTQRRFFRR